MEKENYSGLMDDYMKVTTCWTKKTDTALFAGLMAENTSVDGRMENNTETVFILQMDKRRKVSG